MAKRQKPTAVIIGDVKQADAALAEIAKINRKITEHENHMNEAIDTAKANCDGLCAPLAARRKDLASGLATFGTLNRPQLFTKRKSLKLNFGVIGFRKTSALKTLANVTMAHVLEQLHKLGFKEAIKTTESVDKAVMQDWTHERLESVGMRRVIKDAFFYETDQEAVENAA